MKFWFQKITSSLLGSPEHLTAVELSRSAKDLHRAGVTDPPLGEAAFAIEQLELHARELALSHRVGKRSGGAWLLRRLAGSKRVIAGCHWQMSRAQTAGRRLSPAAEWLLDNHYLVEEQVALAQEHLPPGYRRQLPSLAGGSPAGLPRIYDLILEFVAHIDGGLDDEALSRYVGAYQAVTHLTLGELWSVPIMLRLALIENLRRVAVSISWKRAHRDCALAWARILDVPSEDQEGAVVALAQMVVEDPPLTPPFVAQFTQALQGRGATTTFVLAWLEQRLARRGQTIEELVRAENQSQAADQATMAHCVASLRYVNSAEWHRFVEAHSATEAILAGEVAGVYGKMDFTTRDSYRHVVGAAARRWNLDEEAVARTVVSLADGHHARHGDDVAAHIGYWLVDQGKPQLEQVLSGRTRPRLMAASWLRHYKLPAYLGAAGLLSSVGAAGLLASAQGGFGAAWPWLIFGGAVAASQGALALTNWAATLLCKPRALPRMDFEHGIPPESLCIVVVPTMLSPGQDPASLIEGLELRYIANRDPNLWFGLLTDFSDACEETDAGDAALLEQAAQGIQELNERYAGGRHGRFFLFHRPRLYNLREKCWMGRERKRGKIEDFNALLHDGDPSRFSRIVGDPAGLTGIRYVITLDTDTDLPWGAAWRLVGAAAHPLNRPVMDPEGRRLLRGYAILQPRVNILLRSAAQSRYARLLAGDLGTDPYTRVVSDLYQDLFAETSFVGKGIYDVGAFRRVLHGRFPDNAVLSHDLLESCYARSGQCNDVELLEDSPSGYLADASRRHRWMRGDWQIAPWLGPWISDASGKRGFPGIAALGWWKIFDNLRRATVAPAYLGLLGLGWARLEDPRPWTLTLLALALAPEILPGLTELLQRPPRLALGRHLAFLLRSTLRRLAKAGLWLAFLPFEAWVAADAALRSLWRVAFSRRRLLQWRTAAAVEDEAEEGLRRVISRMGLVPAAAAAAAAALLALGGVRVWSAAWPLLGLWFLSPALAWWMSRPLAADVDPLREPDRRFLRRVARLTWRYFEVFADKGENWLPPDNVQDTDRRRVARRTSPTDMGLALLANLSAHDLGYMGGVQMMARCRSVIGTMEKLERHRGHFLNWYDTGTLEPLRPHYVSTVDSGNLAGHLRVLRSGLLELADAPPLSSQAREGLGDTLDLLAERAGDPDPLAGLRLLLAEEAVTLSARSAWLVRLAAAASTLSQGLDAGADPETAWWTASLRRQIEAFQADLEGLTPWLGTDPQPEGAALPWMATLDRAGSLRGFEALARQAAAALEALGQPAQAQAFQLGAERAATRIREAEDLAARCLGLAGAEFGFLYDSGRKLLSIGYWVKERRLDKSYYDLLASEARLASYLAIASGEIPFEHWFALGRRLTRAGGSQVLLSWSGSMFEYLMPHLVMPAFKGTLLHQTCGAVVARQRQYGRQQGRPWGISESCYDLVDAEGTYQYRAFGVPGLGLQRGLGDDLVVAPYASMLALLVDPARACANLRTLAGQDCLGDYGFIDAVDFSPPRLGPGGQGRLVRTCMAHHHGMSLVAMGQALLGPRMQARFLDNPDLRAAALLLQERIPRDVALMRPFAREAEAVHRLQGAPEDPAMRVMTDLNAAVPDLQLLSNGRYHVMVSAAGGGYSRWNDLALTRWREDPSTEGFGVFFYVGDPKSGRSWSNSFQPTLRRGKSAEAIFTPGRAEFRRHDDQVQTHTEIAVSAEDDLEIRRVTLTNRSDTARSLVLTSFAEVALAAPAADELHRAFHSLFVQTEWLPDLGAILITRRPRSAEERPAWMFCLMPPGARGACSCETDRGLFLGRTRGAQRPAALDSWGPLTGTTGPVLDPCAALRCAMELAPEAAAGVDLIIGAALTRESALALVVKYQDHRMADRVFEMAATHSRAVLGQLGATEAEARRFGQLASGVILPLAAFRAPGSILRRNRRGQSGLWGHAISGDLPIVLLRVGDTENLEIVRDMLKAHAYWRLRGLAADLVIWNEDASGYRRLLNDALLGLVGAGAEAHWLDRPGGVFIRHIDTFPEEDRVLLQAVARIVIRDVDGPLERQLERWLGKPPPALPISAPVAFAAGSQASPVRRDGLLFANGSGGFTPDGREYIVELGPGRQTPAPWVNVIANAKIGTVVSERGSAYTWYGNAQLCRLTPWSNDAVSDPSGEALFLRDEDSGRALSPLPWAGALAGAYECRHGFGYSVFEHSEDGLKTELSTYVAVQASVKFMALKVRNLGGQSRSISIFASADLVLGDLRSRSAMHVVTELEPLTGAILARNSYNNEPSGTVAFFGCSETPRSVSGDRAEVLGRNGDPTRPAALGRRELSGRLGPGLDPCAAIQARLELPPGEEREIVFILGAADSVAEAVELVRRHRGVASARVALKEVWKFWNDKLGVLYVETPDPALDVLVNGWLPYQVLSCRLWGRSGFQQSGGAYGFRDQLQDCLALLHEMPELARQHLLRCAGHQFVEGDVQHWWHPPGNRGVRTNCSDDYLWLPYAVARYVEFSGDTGVLDEEVSYLTGRTLNEGEESYYDLPGRSGQSGTLYEHCVRAIRRGLKTGPHGLPLMGGGDWNDGMNRIGHQGRGESVWLGFFLHHVLAGFAPLALERGDGELAARCGAFAAELERSIEEHAWDGEWYRRAYLDDGRPLGSAENQECRIDSLPQSWATIAGVGEPGRRSQALDATWGQLLDQESRILKLFKPPFDHSDLDPGYIKGYLPGIRENGGQYTHAAVWTAWAFALAGREGQAAELVALLNPINHALDPDGVARYRGEPYAMAADIYSQPPHNGQAGWTWYTGSAGWYYRLLHEVILGVDRRGDRLCIRPRVPAAWESFKLHYRFHQTFYHLDFRRDPGHQGPVRLVLDGQALPGAALTLANDRQEHAVEVYFGADA